MPLMMTVCCYKVYHVACMKEWTSKQQTCMCCRKPLEISHGGKPLEAVWRVFQIAAEYQPSETQAFFNNQALLDSPDLECSYCYEEYSDLGINYHPELSLFSHSTCCPPSLETRVVHLSNLALLAKELVLKDPKLAKEFLQKHDITESYFTQMYKLLSNLYSG